MDVRNKPEKGRFEVTIDGHVAFATYRLSSSRISFLHTEVPEELAGQGVAAKIAQTALEYAQAEGLTVLPYCPYFRAYLKRHPEYRGLVKEGFEL